MDYKIILASNSPRRKELLSGLNIPFKVFVKDGIDESYPESTPVDDVSLYLSRLKSSAYLQDIKEDELIITADTVVVVDDEILGKPKDKDDAFRMLRMISGRTHKVITGVSFTTTSKQRSFKVTTEVTFKELEDKEINYYISTFKPYDKAGSYGIQEWIGYIGVTSIKGSYFNVMGFPVQRIYEELKNI
ncbi:MAG: septum formation protein Maf [Prevotella sp.]|jgi:septum formation protein|nr:Maf-like protein [Prevotella sp.]MBP6526660.1 septum formation protein Maf [Prevotella sp.]MBP8687068.1 septum formation protein Maf [Prevotella sp.]MBP8934458.1 septum formation protein Maf [Prevotella sp.]MBP9982185.1 septum formation protein Maf [Prevotella sp.]